MSSILLTSFISGRMVTYFSPILKQFQTWNVRNLWHKFRPKDWLRRRSVKKFPEDWRTTTILLCLVTKSMYLWEVYPTPVSRLFGPETTSERERTLQNKWTEVPVVVSSDRREWPVRTRERFRLRGNRGVFKTIQSHRSRVNCIKRQKWVRHPL